MSKRQWAQQMMSQQLQQRVSYIQPVLERGEVVHDAGPVNEHELNTHENLAAGEGLLFLTDRRLIMYYEDNGSARSWPYESIRSWAIEKAPRRGMKHLVVHGPDGVTRLMGGRMFLGAAKKTLQLFPIARG